MSDGIERTVVRYQQQQQRRGRSTLAQWRNAIHVLALSILMFSLMVVRYGQSDSNRSPLLLLLQLYCTIFIGHRSVWLQQGATGGWIVKWTSSFNASDFPDRPLQDTGVRNGAAERLLSLKRYRRKILRARCVFAALHFDRR